MSQQFKKIIQGKYWCFTNYKLDTNYNKWLENHNAEYIIYGIELCPTTGRTHHQGYIEFKSNKRLSALKKIDEAIHWEYRNGSAEQAEEYCMKDGEYITLGNKKNKQQGKRNDINDVRELIKSGKGMKEITETVSSYQALKSGELMLKYIENKRNWKPQVMWLYGTSVVVKHDTHTICV